MQGTHLQSLTETFASKPEPALRCTTLMLLIIMESKFSGDLEKVVKGADAVVVLAGHSAYYDVTADWVKKLTGKAHPVIIDGRNVIEPDEFIGKGLVYKGIGRGDKNEHLII